MMRRMALFWLLFQCICINFVRAKERNFVRKDQELVDSLQHYEFVTPKLSNILTVGGSTAQKSVKNEPTILKFRLRGKTFTLNLTLNRNLFSGRFTERYITASGSEVTRKNSHFCFFHGHVDGHKEESVAAISTCDGVNGYFTLLDKTYFIQPVTSVEGEVFHIVFEAEHVHLPRYKCGYSDHNFFKPGHDFFKPRNLSFSKASRRVRRDVLSETKYLETVFVSDYSQYQAYGNKTALRAKTIANIVDSVYRVHKIRVILVALEVWETSDKIAVGFDEQMTLENFETYKETVLNKAEATKSDNAQMLTQQKFHKGIVGKASHLSICAPTSAGVVTDHSSNAALSASTLAHELGHNFGLNHDIDPCECGNANGCVMASYVSYSPLLKMSNCSIKELETTLLRNYGTCLFDQPTTYIRDAECGNAFIDEGEQCDCGTKVECELAGNNCCHFNTCLLHSHSQCSDGPCCDNCKLKRRGAMCRDKVNDCDLPEYCDGKSELCVSDSFVHNGRPCGDGQSICYLGVCHTLDDQCKTFWGAQSTKGHSNCYKYLNTRADAWGHCKKLSGGGYQKCASKDQLCGKLQCGNPVGSWSPIIGTKRQAHSISVGSAKCWSGLVYMGDDIPEPGMVQTGTQCGENKVCANNTCVDVDVAFEQPKCANNCSGNGICNNLGHCHCNLGYRCPDCKESCPSYADGDGGSIDSGNGCDCPDINTTMSTTMFTTTQAATTVATTVATTGVTSTTVPVATEGHKKKSDSDPDAGTIAASVLVPVILLSIIFVCVYFRHEILEKIGKVRKREQEGGFRSAVYNSDHPGGSTSHENLTEIAVGQERPTSLNVGGTVPNQVVITPDVNPVKPKELKPDFRRPFPPRLPSRPSFPPRPLGSKNKSLPDLLGGDQLRRPLVQFAPDKTESFNMVDKPTRPKLPKSIIRQTSFQEKGTKANLKPPRLAPLIPREKPASSPPSDPFNRSALRKTPGDPKLGSEVSRQSTEESPSAATVEHTFRPSDLKAEKLPFSAL